MIELDPHLRATNSERARRVAEDARDLRRKAASLDAFAASLARTWDLCRSCFLLTSECACATCVVCGRPEYQHDRPEFPDACVSFDDERK